jgi:hypothetical protein
MLDHISIEDKAAAFDAMVKEFQGKGRYVFMKRRDRVVTTGVSAGITEAICVTDDYPVYEFVMRVDGHNDFASAVLALLPKRGEEAA